MLLKTGIVSNKQFSLTRFSLTQEHFWSIPVISMTLSNSLTFPDFPGKCSPWYLLPAISTSPHVMSEHASIPCHSFTSAQHAKTLKTLLRKLTGCSIDWWTVLTIPGPDFARYPLVEQDYNCLSQLRRWSRWRRWSTESTCGVRLAVRRHQTCCKHNAQL